MRCLPVVVVVVAAAACSDPPPPSAAVEKAARALYLEPFAGRQQEREALRLQGTEKLKGTLVALEASCQEILASDLPNHGLRGDAVAAFQRDCIDPHPLSCGLWPATLQAVEVPSIQGDAATAIARVAPTGPEAKAPMGVELSFRVVDGAWKIDDVICPR